MNETLLRSRARGAFERGMPLEALPHALPALALGAIAVRCGCAPSASLGLSILLAAGIALLAWHSRAMRRAAHAGLAAGLVPFALPFLACGSGLSCEPGACDAVMTSAAAGGAVAGVLVALLAARASSSRRFASVVAAAFVAFGAGSLGCSPAGLAGAVALALGLLATTAPVLALRRA